MPHLPQCACALLLSSALASGSTPGGIDPAAALDQTIAAAESSLRSGEVQIAESRYRSALLEGWLLIGILDRIDGRVPEAREAFLRASTSAVDDRLALLSLAIADLQLGKATEAVEVLTRLRRKRPKDVQTRRLLAQALAVSGQPEQALRELEAVRAAHPGDLELAFALANAYLQQKRVDDAARLFAQILLARPIPQTHVLIGRIYRDHGEYARARAELRAALKQDPRVQRAHYNLGMAAVKERGTAVLDEAIAEFREELKFAPRDPVTNFELGVALVEGQRSEEAVAPLEIAIPTFDPPQARAFYYLGRAQLGANRPADAATSLRRALDLAQVQGAGDEALKMIRLQLGQALRRIGKAEESAEQFAEAERLSLSGAEAERAQMARYMASVPEPGAPATSPAVPVIEASPLASLEVSERLALRRRVASALARSYLNLGVMQARSERFARAAEQFEQAAALDPDFPQVQSSLGVAYFNARQFQKAAAPLARALAANPDDAALKRMLAMAYLESQEHGKAADLLRGDPELDRNPSLQFAYGLALVKSDRAAEAELVFSRLFARHGASAELSVLLGQAYAQQGDFDRAVESLLRALRLQADVVGANAALGVIYLRQGKHAEAEAALRAEVARNPGDLQSQQNLAVVLESEQRPEEAIPVLRGALQVKPDFTDARYLLGKILLAQGNASEAVEHLEAAARLAPDDANTHYQLGRAYQKLGRTEQAQQEFDLFRQIKAKR
jgi:tetratricopeptide (TPR) repeat protein